MTQLIVSIDSPSAIADIRKAIKMIKGVVDVRTKKAQPNPKTVAAINDAKNGNTIHCRSFADYKNLVADIDNV